MTEQELQQWRAEQAAAIEANEAERDRLTESIVLDNGRRLDAVKRSFDESRPLHEELREGERPSILNHAEAQAWRDWVEANTRYTARTADDYIRWWRDHNRGGNRWVRKQEHERDGGHLRSQVRNAEPEQLVNILEDDPKARQNIEAALDRVYEKRTAQRNQEFLDKKWCEAGYTPEEAEQVRAQRVAQLERIAMPARASEEFELAAGAMGQAFRHLQTIESDYATAIEDDHLASLRGWAEWLEEKADTIERKRADAQRFAARRVG